LNYCCADFQVLPKISKRSCGKEKEWWRSHSAEAPLLKHRRFGSTARRRRRVTARIVIVVITVVVIIVVAGLTSVTRAVEFLVGDEGAQVGETDVARAAIARPALGGIQTLLRWWRWRVLAFLLHLIGDHLRWRRRRQRSRLRTLPDFHLAIHLHFCRDLLRRRGGRRLHR